MENTKQIFICGYCGNKILDGAKGTLTIADPDGKIIDKIDVCNGCSKRLHVKIALSRMSKEDVESLDNFLRREKK